MRGTNPTLKGLGCGRTSAKTPRNGVTLVYATTTPKTPPKSERRRLSVSNWRNSRALPAPSATLPVYLARLGRDLLDGVASKPTGGRELALDLLAADAFATYAFEATYEA